MSHFAEIKVDYQQKYEGDLIAALEEQFGPKSVEVHQEGSPLFGYQGDNRATKSKNSEDYAPPCHLVIRRKNVGSASNDVGYRRTEDGKYSAYISDFDSGANFGPQKQGLVAQEYGLRVSERQLKLKGYRVQRNELPNGAVQLEATHF